MQGYYFSKPAAENEFISPLIKTNQTQVKDKLIRRVKKDTLYSRLSVAWMLQSSLHGGYPFHVSQ